MLLPAMDGVTLPWGWNPQHGVYCNSLSLLDSAISGLQRGQVPPSAVVAEGLLHWLAHTEIIALSAQSSMYASTTVM